MDEEPVERRVSANDIREISRRCHQLDTRVAVMETRVDGQDHRLGAIEKDIRDIKIGVERVLETLAGHIAREAMDRIKLMAWVISTLLAVIGFGAATFLDRILPK